MKDKITWIVIGQIVGCFLVVAGHSFPFGIDIPVALEMNKTFLYLFHMSFFVFISGFLFGYSGGYEKYGTTQYIKKRAIRLLIPYFIISFIGLIPKFLVAPYINDATPDGFSWKYLMECLFVPRDGVWGHFWFLPMLFLVQLIGFLGAYVYKKSVKLYCLLLLFTFLLTYIYPYTTKWFSISDVCIYLFWYLLGFALVKSKLYEIRVSLYWSLIFLIIAIVSFFIIGGIAQPLIAILMILAIVGVCQNIRMEKWWIFKKMKGNSFAVFILSWPVQCIIEIVTNKLLHWNVYICMLSMFLAGIIVPLLIIYIVKLIERPLKTNKLSLIIGA